MDKKVEQISEKAEYEYKLRIKREQQLEKECKEKQHLNSLRKRTLTNKEDQEKNIFKLGKTTKQILNLD